MLWPQILLGALLCIAMVAMFINGHIARRSPRQRPPLAISCDGYVYLRFCTEEAYDNIESAGYYHQITSATVSTSPFAAIGSTRSVGESARR